MREDARDGRAHCLHLYLRARHWQVRVAHDAHGVREGGPQGVSPHPRI